MSSLLVTEEEVQARISPQDAVETVRSAFLDLAQGKASNIPRSRTRTQGASLHIMGAASDSLGYLGSKVYAATRSSMHSMFLLFRASTGELVAQISANELGRLRTAASAVVAMEALVPKGQFRATLFGTGFQAAGLCAALFRKTTSHQIFELKVLGRKSEKTAEFAKSMSRQFGANVVPASNTSEALAGSDLIFCATSTQQPLFSAKDSSAATFIAALGSNALPRVEISADVVTSANLICVDSLESAKLEGGNFLEPLRSGAWVWENVHELGTLLSSATLPSSTKKTVLFCSHGIAVQDLYVAVKIFERIRNESRKIHTQ